MCYSAMVEQNAKKYGLRFKARIQTDLYYDLFKRRLDGEKIYINKAMEEHFTHGASTAEEAAIAGLITKWHTQQIPVLERELFAQKKRLDVANEQLAKKTTKKAENERRIASNKIEKLKLDLERHQSTRVGAEIEERIFPLHYMSMLCLDERGERVVRPVRYLLRPHDKDASFDVKFNGCYNARFDSLESVPWWRDSFGKRHGIILAKKFYENVETSRYAKENQLPSECADREKLVLCFQPEGVEYMVLPTVWDLWTDGSARLYSAALITDDPAPEIARAGHDRTPIFLDEGAVDTWLHAERSSATELKEVLGRRLKPHYAHRVLGAA